MLRRWLERWGIPTDHFDANAARGEACRRRAQPIEEILVERSTYARKHLKRRLFAEGLKDRRCELCGQGEVWRGRPMALILDHVNGVADDNRIENLRIVCPNCAATLDTHCGRNTRLRDATCATCGGTFRRRSPSHRWCSPECVDWTSHNAHLRGVSNPEARKVVRPPVEELIDDVATMSMVAVGRKHGVSDNAVRKWLRQYGREREARRGGGRAPAATA